MNDQLDKWRNLGRYRDDEIEKLDEIENSLAPLDDSTIRTRELITRLEMCHHKAKRHVDLIIKAIGDGVVNKFPTKEWYGDQRPEQQRWKTVGDILNMWISDMPENAAIERYPEYIEDIQDFYNRLGDPGSLKIWQVTKLRDRILGHVFEDVEYKYILRDEPDSDFKTQTMEQKVRMSSKEGESQEYTLGGAIDNAVPCNWNFETNLRMILSSIGGAGSQKGILSAHAANIEFNPIKKDMIPIVESLDKYASGQFSADNAVHGQLGEQSDVKKWLAGSLAKTIKVQLKI